MKYKHIEIVSETAKASFPKRWTRKGRCPSCKTKSGNAHRQGCGLEYVHPMETSKPTKSNVETIEQASQRFAEQRARVKRDIKSKVVKLLIIALIIVVSLIIIA